MSIYEFIERYRPCDSACAWLRTLPTGSTMRDAWLACQDPAWMAWCVGKVGTKRDRVVAGVALVRRTPVGDGRVVFDLLTDPRSRDAILTAERWVAGEATDEDLAADAEAAAAGAAARAAAARAAAAWAAGEAAWAAGWAAGAAARAAAWAATAWAWATTAAWAWAAEVGEAQARSAQPAILREALPGFFLEADHA